MVEPIWHWVLAYGVSCVVLSADKVESPRFDEATDSVNAMRSDEYL